ncbi:protein kinase family protein [Francisella sp. W12-1067]
MNKLYTENKQTQVSKKDTVLIHFYDIKTAFITTTRFYNVYLKNFITVYNNHMNDEKISMKFISFSEAAKYQDLEASLTQIRLTMGKKESFLLDSDPDEVSLDSFEMFISFYNRCCKLAHHEVINYKHINLVFDSFYPHFLETLKHVRLIYNEDSIYGLKVILCDYSNDIEQQLFHLYGQHHKYGPLIKERLKIKDKYIPVPFFEGETVNQICLKKRMTAGICHAILSEIKRVLLIESKMQKRTPNHFFMHADLNASNIIVNEETKDVVIIDFSFSSQFIDETDHVLRETLNEMQHGVAANSVDFIRVKLLIENFRMIHNDNKLFFDDSILKKHTTKKRSSSVVNGSHFNDGLNMTNLKTIYRKGQLQHTYKHTENYMKYKDIFDFSRHFKK